MSSVFTSTFQNQLASLNVEKNWFKSVQWTSISNRFVEVKADSWEFWKVKTSSNLRALFLRTRSTYHCTNQIIQLWIRISIFVLKSPIGIQLTNRFFILLSDSLTNMQSFNYGPSHLLRLHADGEALFETALLTIGSAHCVHLAIVRLPRAKSSKANYFNSGIISALPYQMELGKGCTILFSWTEQLSR